MILKLDIERVRTVDEVRDFMAGSEPVDFHLTERRGAYDFVTRTLRRLNYAGLSKADKGVVRRFVAKVTGLSRAQSTRLIGQYQNTGHIRDRRCGATRPFERRYTAVDIRLLAEVDEMRIPVQPDHRIRRKPITDSDSTRSLIPDEPDHRFRCQADHFFAAAGIVQGVWCEGARGAG